MKKINDKNSLWSLLSLTTRLTAAPIGITRWTPSEPSSLKAFLARVPRKANTRKVHVGVSQVDSSYRRMIIPAQHVLETWTNRVRSQFPQVWEGGNAVLKNIVVNVALHSDFTSFRDICSVNTTSGKPHRSQSLIPALHVIPPHVVQSVAGKQGSPIYLARGKPLYFGNAGEHEKHLRHPTIAQFLVPFFLILIWHT